MAEISQFQSVFRVAKPEISLPTTSSKVTKAKRNRQALFCVSCRNRKLKCDRQAPCSTCANNGIGQSCRYAARPSNGFDRHDEGLRSSEAHLRLQKLEEMVTSLMQKTVDGLGESKSETYPSNENIEQRIGSLSVDRSLHRTIRKSNGHMDYQGGTHWSAILENIRDIQDALEPELDAIEDPTNFCASSASKFPDIAITTHRTLTLADVFETLPPRPQVDRILNVYFGAKDTRNPILHSKKFLREYEIFWADPSSMSFLWISLLFSVLYIGSSFERAMSARVLDSIDDSLQSQFLIRAAEALVTGGYQKARQYSVEAVISFAYCKFMQKEDPDADACMVMGIAARLALKMGYHRDPRLFPNLTPFEGEMRRRVFFLVETFDLLLSFQAGMPPIINEEECDVDPPRNLSDEDFDEDCTELPPSRPPVEATSMLYFHYKSVFAKTFRRVMRHALSVKSPPYEDTVRLDRELLELQDKKPACLQMKLLATFKRESAAIVFDILNIDLMYLKCVCVLHRKYITHERSNPKYEYSRSRCIDAALKILTLQTELHAACQPGGQYFEDKWMISNLIIYDFILAGIIVCLDLFESQNTSSYASLCDLKIQAQRYDILTHARDIWNSRKESSRDARRAGNVLSVILSKIPRPTVTCATMNLHQGNGPQPLSNQNAFVEIPTDISDDSNWNNEFFLPGEEFGAGNFAALDFSSALFTESDQIDWALVDQYLIDRGVMSDVPLEWEN